jgi:hypothetical protein
MRPVGMSLPEHTCKAGSSNIEELAAQMHHHRTSSYDVDLLIYRLT